MMPKLFIFILFILINQIGDAISQTNSNSPSLYELNANAANLIITGRVTVGKEISLIDATGIALYFLEKNNKPQVAWDLIFKILSEKIEIDVDHKWLLIDTLAEASRYINKDPISNVTMRIILNQLMSSEPPNKYTFMTVEKIFDNLKNNESQLGFDIILAYLNSLLKNLTVIFIWSLESFLSEYQSYIITPPE